MANEVRCITVAPDDVIQDGVVLSITTDEAIRSILARAGWPPDGAMRLIVFRDVIPALESNT